MITHAIYLLSKCSNLYGITPFKMSAVIIIMSTDECNCSKVSSFNFRIKQNVGSRVLSLSIANVTGMDQFKTPISFIFEVWTVRQ